MCKCKVCSDKQGYEKLMRELNDVLSHTDIDYQLFGKILNRLDEYEAYYYVSCEPISVFLYNSGEKLDHEDYRRSPVDLNELSHFDYCPHCGRKLNGKEE